MPETTDTPPLVFRATKWAHMSISIGACICFVLFIFPVTRSVFMAAIMLVAISVWRLRSAYVTLYSDYFQTKLSPIAGWHAVLYKEVTRVEKDGKILNIYYKKFNAAEGAKPTRIKLRLGELDETERKRLTEAFHVRMPDVFCR